MKILLYSTRYMPEIGGMETVARILARSWSSLGDDVTVISGAPRLRRCRRRETVEHATDIQNVSPRYIRVIRDPSMREFIAEARNADIVVQANVSLPATWILKVVSRALIVVHHTWYASGIAWKDFIKRYTTPLVYNIAVSEQIRRHIPSAGVFVIPNPFEEEVFFPKFCSARESAGVLFVGRLVPDKGVDILLKAGALLRDMNQPIKISIVGDGPEAQNLRNLALELNLLESVVFVGALELECLADAYRAHHVVVVPSRWEEPFGVVALEALACGCQVVVTPSGALPDVVGAFGIVSPTRSPGDLAQSIRKALVQPVGHDGLSTYLAGFSSRAVALRYREVMESAQ